MGSFQQQSRMRKVVYFALIVGIFTFNLVLRKHMITPRANDLSLREENVGQADPTGSVVYLTLTGSRGLVVSYLWNLAQDKQKKHEWNELELIVNSLTKLQPHFITPWLFQSWNLAYNVSVESDRVKDKYFYVTRGIELLGEGERRNRDQPDLRLNMGFYYQNKFGVSDENNTFRSLFQLAYINPRERDPRRFRAAEGSRGRVNLEEFKDFCVNHPHLVRRLREKLGCNRPEQVVEFLSDNRRIPGLYQEDAYVLEGQAFPLKPVDNRFPILPPPSRFDPSEPYTLNTTLFPDDFNNYDAARAWFGYSQDPVDDPNVNRKPRYLTLVIFQGYPARAQAYRAERLEEDGWFGKEGWTIEDWFPDPARGGASTQPVVVGGDREWAKDAWSKAFEMIRRHGIEHGVLKTPAERAAMSESSEEYREYSYRRHVSNYDHFYVKARVEQKPEVIDARRHFFRAERLRSEGKSSEALAEYEHPAAYGPPTTWWTAPTGWKKVLLDNFEFRDDKDTQRDSYKTQVNYLKLVERWPYSWARTLRNVLALQDVLGRTAAQPPGVPLWLPPADLARNLAVPLRGPLDDVDERGKPLISPEIVSLVRVNMPAERPAAPQPTPPAQPGP